MNISTSVKPETDTQNHWDTVCDEVLSLQVATSSYDDLDSVKKNLVVNLMLLTTERLKISLETLLDES